MMESLCLTEEMVDCTLTAGRTSFSAHRMVSVCRIVILMIDLSKLQVLSTCSPYFRSLFASVPSHQVSLQLQCWVTNPRSVNLRSALFEIF